MRDALATAATPFKLRKVLEVLWRIFQSFPFKLYRLSFRPWLPIKAGVYSLQRPFLRVALSVSMQVQSFNIFFYVSILIALFLKYFFSFWSDSQVKNLWSWLKFIARACYYWPQELYWMMNRLRIRFCKTLCLLWLTSSQPRTHSPGLRRWSTI